MGHHCFVAKYDPLFDYLCRAPDAEVELTFEDISGWVGGMPAFAGARTACLANKSKGTRHVLERACRSGGHEVVAVDRVERRILFSEPGS